MAQNGMVGAVNTTLPRAMIDGAFTAIAWYNVIEINAIIFLTFKKRHGLYFWSLMVASWGIAIYALASLMKFFRVWENDYVSIAFITIGWYAMVTGQSVVQYSRLHLVVYDRRQIRWVLYMIIVNAVLFHIPTTVLTFGSNSPLRDVFELPYSWMEKVQVTAFSIQEFIISSVYVWRTRKMLQPAMHRSNNRRVMLNLLIVNILVIFFDITLVAIEFANEYEIETTYKGALYSVKLRLEFAVLDALVTYIKANDDAPSVPLQTFAGRSLRADNRMETTAYFARGSNDTRAGKINENGVMKTTEIAIEHEPTEAELQKGRLNPRTSQTLSDVGSEKYGTQTPYSRSSSQVELAGTASVSR